MFRIHDHSNNSINKVFRNNGSSIIIHEHDFVPIRLKGEEEQKSIICLTCGSFYSENSGKLLVSTMRS
jgi:predicted nuclease of predicted toxin-antitoxin system